MAKNLTIVIGGQIASIPFQGGATWAVLQYVLGLRELGHQVYFVEQVPDQFLAPPGTDLTHSRNALYFRSVVHDFSLGNSSALVNFHRREAVGMEYSSVLGIARRADLLINLSGHLPAEPWFHLVPIRVYLDLDPLFTQLWKEVEQIDMHFAGHTHFATVGMAVGSANCLVPTCGLQWIRTWQPIVLSRWPSSNRVSRNAATTVANWRSYGSLHHEGVFYGQKVHSWRAFMNLPLLSNWRFAAALSIDPTEADDLAALRRNRWELIDPEEVVSTPQQYWEFIQGSMAELAIVKSGYAVSRCGWFSERSECYTASGKPVVAQATGFEQYLPCGKGVFAFADSEQAVEALKAIEADYSLHSRAARTIAEEFFDSRKVLERLLAQVGVAG